MVDFKLPHSDPRQPWIMQIAALLVNTEDWREHGALSLYVKPGAPVSPKAFMSHGISDTLANTAGVELSSALYCVADLARRASLFVAHNAVFDLTVLRAAYYRVGWPDVLPQSIPVFDTMRYSTNVVKAPRAKGRGYKWPTLSECYKHFFGEVLVGAHDALTDTRACARVFRALRERGTNGSEAE